MEPKKRKFIQRLRIPYRLVIMSEKSLEEKYAFTLTPMNVFIAASTLLVLFTALVVSLIVFTPVREYIPGYSGNISQRQLDQYLLRTDSLQQTIRQQDRYIQVMHRIINGETLDLDSLKQDSLSGNLNDMVDSLLAAANNKELQKEEKKENRLEHYALFPPVRGYISQTYNPGNDHPAVDVVTRDQAPVKSVFDGTVIFTGYTSETGNVIGIQHPNNLISFYKHNATVFKKPGTFVNAGEVIAIVGNSGEQTDGPHLHFELWYDGRPVDPQSFVVF